MEDGGKFNLVLQSRVNRRPTTTSISTTSTTHLFFSLSLSLTHLFALASPPGNVSLVRSTHTPQQCTYRLQADSAARPCSLWPRHDARCPSYRTRVWCVWDQHLLHLLHLPIAQLSIQLTMAHHHHHSRSLTPIMEHLFVHKDKSRPPSPPLPSRPQSMSRSRSPGPPIVVDDDEDEEDNNGRRRQALKDGKVYGGIEA